MRKTLLVVCGALGVYLSAAAVNAQNLQMVDAPASARVAIPQRGLSMAQVEQRFGAPARRVSAVGQPPISRWVYPDFVVYFERSLVLHAVAISRTPTS
jgi:hypothetical protein